MVDRTSLGQRRRSFFAVILLVWVVVVSTCEATPRSSYALFHRLGPSLTSTSHSTHNGTEFEWRRRAVLEISSNLPDAPPHLNDIRFVVSSFVKNNEPLQIPHSIPLESLHYQISLLPQDSKELPGESGHPDTGFAFSSHPLCSFLSDRSSTKPPTNEYLNIWIRPTAIPSSKLEDEPSHSIHNLQLDLLGIQWSSSPPSSGSKSDACLGHLDQSVIKSQLTSFVNNHGHSSIKVSVRKPEKLVEPILKPYPTHKNAEFLPDGRMKEPAPEKGFLAKYWMYILPLVIVLVMGGGAPPEENGPADQPQSSS